MTKKSKKKVGKVEKEKPVDFFVFGKNSLSDSESEPEENVEEVFVSRENPIFFIFICIFCIF